MQRPKKDIEGSRRERRKKIDTPSFYVQLRCTICHTGTRATVSGDKNSQITTVDSDPACLFFLTQSVTGAKHPLQRFLAT